MYMLTCNLEAEWEISSYGELTLTKMYCEILFVLV